MNNDRIKTMWEESTGSMWPRPGEFTAGEYDTHLAKFAELIERDAKSKMCGPSKYDKRRVLTKGKIIKALKDIPDDVPILVNVEFADGENWDTYYAFIADMSFMCPGYSGCTHTEPEMDYEVVLGVKFGHELGIMENLDDHDYE